MDLGRLLVSLEVFLVGDGPLVLLLANFSTLVFPEPLLAMVLLISEAPLRQMDLYYLVREFAPAR